jgi:hypothetical protein
MRAGSWSNPKAGCAGAAPFERCGVFDATFHPAADAVRVVFRPDERQRDVEVKVENIIGVWPNCD